ncbi:PREDICTED: uncharacterized protein LOC105595109 [Cercocebus atys]|uniref:uncharacterized protein LOC105595109 n=1 Tax=Cercocebus atys TaxID=9531 RepID=UPI0005F39E8D|nr:PREDICTED: uncharacterized protein LOC105595109 [Cercocebus atys]
MQRDLRDLVPERDLPKDMKHTAGWDSTVKLRKRKYSIFQKVGRKPNTKGGGLKFHQRKYVAQDRSSGLDPTSLQPEEEESQGPPELGVDTQILPVNDLLNPPMSHPTSLTVINHSLITHREALTQLLTEESFSLAESDLMLADFHLRGTRTTSFIVRSQAGKLTVWELCRPPGCGHSLLGLRGLPLAWVRAPVRSQQLVEPQDPRAARAAAVRRSRQSGAGAPGDQIDRRRRPRSGLRRFSAPSPNRVAPLRGWGETPGGGGGAQRARSEAAGDVPASPGAAQGCGLQAPRALRPHERPGAQHPPTTASWFLTTPPGPPCFSGASLRSAALHPGPAHRAGADGAPGPHWGAHSCSCQMQKLRLKEAMKLDQVLQRQRTQAGISTQAVWLQSRTATLCCFSSHSANIGSSCSHFEDKVSSIGILQYRWLSMVPVQPCTSSFSRWEVSFLFLLPCNCEARLEHTSFSFSCASLFFTAPGSSLLWPSLMHILLHNSPGSELL